MVPDKRVRTKAIMLMELLAAVSSVTPEGVQTKCTVKKQEVNVCYKQRATNKPPQYREGIWGSGKDDRYYIYNR